MPPRRPASVDMVEISEASRRTGLHPDSIRRGIVNGEFPGYRIGRRYVIPRLMFDKWLRGDWQPKERVA